MPNHPLKLMRPIRAGILKSAHTGPHNLPGAFGGGESPFTSPYGRTALKDDLARTVLVRNFGFWIVAAVLYPIAHWIPTATGHPPRIFDVLVPILVLGLGLASNAVLGAAFKNGHRDRIADAEPSPAADRGGM